MISATAIVTTNSQHLRSSFSWLSLVLASRVRRYAGSLSYFSSLSRCQKNRVRCNKEMITPIHQKDINCDSCTPSIRISTLGVLLHRRRQTYQKQPPTNDVKKEKNDKNIWSNIQQRPSTSSSTIVTRPRTTTTTITAHSPQPAYLMCNHTVPLIFLQLCHCVFKLISLSKFQCGHRLRFRRLIIVVLLLFLFVTSSSAKPCRGQHLPSNGEEK